MTLTSLALCALTLAPHPALAQDAARPKPTLDLVLDASDRRVAFRRIHTKTRKAVQAAQAWLVHAQEEDGSWKAGSLHPGNAQSGLDDTGVTSLALLTLLAGGDMSEGSFESEAFEKGLAWLLARQDAKTGLIGEKIGHMYLYGHATATLVLGETVLVLDRNELLPPLEKAVSLIELARNKDAGWRYSVPPNGKSDTSVTAWMTTALVTALECGVKVDDACFAGAQQWIESVTDPASGRVGYDVKGSRSARVTGVNDHYSPDATEAMTAAGLFCRILFGERPKSEPRAEAHAALLMLQQPVWSEDGGTCDMYYWYYGTLAMKQCGGKRWKAWNKSLGKELLAHQVEKGKDAGSWDPIGPWGHAGGRAYSTAMCALSLAIDARYAVIK